MKILKGLFVVAFCAIGAQAASITFTETQNGIGSLGGTSFNDALVTLTLTGNTSNITNPSSGIYDLIGTATVSVAGVGSATFTDSIEVFVDQNTPAAGFTDLTLPGAPDILENHSSSYSTYTLNTAIGPLTGFPGGNPSDSFATTAGAFILSSSGNSDHDSTFTATGGVTTPEPGTFALLGAGLGVALIGVRRKAKNA